MSDIPKFLSKQELELQEVNYIFSLRAERDKLQEQLNTAKKALTEISEIVRERIHTCDYGCDNHCELNGTLGCYAVDDIKQALTAIGGDDEL